MNRIDRFFTDDDTSYFLFGPRGTGKTTWLNAVCGDGYRIDLLVFTWIDSVGDGYLP